MKKLYTLVLSLATFGIISAQATNRTETDCNNNSKTIYDVLGSGKSLIVASKGLDCSICRSTAPGLQTFASANATKVEVWGALTNTYSNNNPTCTEVQSWISSYGWNDIFTFSDMDRFYFNSGTPIYWVYNPADSTRMGPMNQSSAEQQALAWSLVGTVGVEESVLKDFYWYQKEGVLYLNSLATSTVSIEILNLSGQLVFSEPSSSGSLSVDVKGFAKGIYLVSASTGSAREVHKIALN